MRMHTASMKGWVDSQRPSGGAIEFRPPQQVGLVLWIAKGGLGDVGQNQWFTGLVLLTATTQARIIAPRAHVSMDGAS